MRLIDNFRKAAKEAINKVLPQTIYGKAVSLGKDQLHGATLGYKAVRVSVEKDQWEIKAYKWPNVCVGAPVIIADWEMQTVAKTNSREEAQKWLDTHPMTVQKAGKLFHGSGPGDRRNDPPGLDA